MHERRRKNDKAQEEEAHELLRVIQQVKTNQLLRSLAIGAFCLFTILGVLAYGIINTNRRALQNETVTRAGVACIIEQIAEHRVNSAIAEDESARNHGYPPVSRPNPVLDPNQLAEYIKSACRRFVK